MRPSNLLCIDDDYTAFCFDEACAEIMAHIDQGEKPVFSKKHEGESKSLTSLYAKYE